MERKVIPPEKYVQKALIDQIFSSTIGTHSHKNIITPGYFKILKKNLLDSISIKKPKEEEKNPTNKNKFMPLKSAKNISSWNKILTSKKIYSAKIDSKNNSNKVLTKRSYTSKNGISFRDNKYNRVILSSFGFRTINRDFSDVTSKINYLLDKNQILLMKENNFVEGFDFRKKYKLDENMFIRKPSAPRSGTFGKKFEMPLAYEISITHKNDYISKSEKRRHEYLLNQLNKLKFFLEQNPSEKLLIIKDFFLKFNIKDLNFFSEQRLYNICNLIESCNNKDLVKIIKPDINIKKMLYNLLNIPSNKNNQFYSKINLNRSKNTTRNKYIRISRNKSKEVFGVFETNSDLKYIENQKKLYRPDKNYSENLNLIIKDMNKEVKRVKDSIVNNKNDSEDNTDIFFITQSKKKPFTQNKLNRTNLISANNNFNKIVPNSKGTYFIFRKSLIKKHNNFSNKENKEVNFCLKAKTTKNNNKVKVTNNKINKKKVDFYNLIQRLYYKYHLKYLGLEEVKRNKKLTEFIALNFAKKKAMRKYIENML